MRRTSFLRILPLLLFLALLIAGVSYLYMVSKAEPGPLQASGTVEAREVIAAPEMGGRVSEVLVGEGQRVELGDVLLRMDDTLLMAQRDRASAALGSAMSALRTARASMEAARVQAEIVRLTARTGERPARTALWRGVEPEGFRLPVWYFGQSELIEAARGQLDKAQDASQAALEELYDLLDEELRVGLVTAERRLSLARESYLLARQVLQRAQLAGDSQELVDAAQALMDDADDELAEAQQAYDDLLSADERQVVFEARARLAIAQEHYRTEQDRLDQLMTGEFSPLVAAADVALELSVTSEEQAAAAVAQARAELNAIDVQLAKLVIRAPASGIVLARNVEPGEVIQPGSPALTIAQLDDLWITVFIPEDRYGELSIGTEAVVSVDSYPGEAFEAVVSRIADKAEFTPRNVQTEEGRRITVFAIELAVSDPTGKLKPGMPADVRFAAP